MMTSVDRNQLADIIGVAIRKSCLEYFSWNGRILWDDGVESLVNSTIARELFNEYEDTLDFRVFLEARPKTVFDNGGDLILADLKHYARKRIDIVAKILGATVFIESKRFNRWRHLEKDANRISELVLTMRRYNKPALGFIVACAFENTDGSHPLNQRWQKNFDDGYKFTDELETEVSITTEALPRPYRQWDKAASIVISVT